ncbi:MAG: sulfatase-like hydrolase/transferase [Planctomycetota bacterium]
MEKHPDLIQDLPESQLDGLVSFLAMGSNIDDNVGRLMEFLEQTEQLNNTIVVFLTDNGSTMGPKYFNAGMRGKKTQLWDGGHRVPCFIRSTDASFGEPRDIDTLTQVQDLLPTLASMAGIKRDWSTMDGDDLTPLLRGQSNSFDDRSIVINYSRMPGMRVTYTEENPEIPHPDGAAILWKKWRLLENRMLFDVSVDPHQDRDVAGDFPGVMQKLKAKGAEAWESIEDTVSDVQRVVIGSEFENPMTITACEWLDVFVDQQLQVRLGQRKNGIWHLVVDQPGTYRFTLRRFPTESGLAITGSLPPTAVTDGVYLKAPAMPVVSGRMRLGDFDEKANVDPDGKGVTFTAEVDKGPIELQTWLLDAEGQEIAGAYYVDLERL